MLAGSPLLPSTRSLFGNRASCSHMKCQPAWRIIVSKTGAGISSTTHPVFADGLRAGDPTVPAGRILAQENGMQLHACALFDAAGVCRADGTGQRIARRDGCAGGRMFRNEILSKSRWICFDCVRFGAGKAGCIGLAFGLAQMDLCAESGETGGSLHRSCLTRLMAAPVVRLRA